MKFTRHGTPRLIDVRPIRELLTRTTVSEFLCDDEYDIGLMYRRELQEVVSRSAFEQFVRRWAGFYVLGYNENRNQAELALQHRFNVKRIYAKWRACDSGINNAYNGSGYYYGLAAAVALPTVLLTTFQVSRRYQVPFNVALVQIYDKDHGEFF